MKQDRELSALRRVYLPDDFESVRPQDSPDFVLRHHRAATQFGVEVTELYESQAEARIVQRPEYVSDLLAGGRHMHRDDVVVLSVSTAKIEDADGNLKAEGVPAILRKLSSPQQHAAAIAAVLRRKTARFDDYASGLSHVNLIIVDRFKNQRGLDDEYHANDLLTSELRAALQDTGFREVFLVTQKTDSTWVYRPLQQLRLLESFSLFLGALASFPDTPDSLEWADLLALFVHAMAHRDLDVYVSAPNDGPSCAVHRGAGIRHTGDNIEVLDFHDHDPPAAADLPPPPVAAHVMEAFVGHHSSFLEVNVFITGLGIQAADSDEPSLQ